MSSSMLPDGVAAPLAEAGCGTSSNSRSAYPNRSCYNSIDIQAIAGASVALSVSGKEWKFPPEIKVDEKLLEVADGSLLLSKLLIKRGIRSAADAKVFLNCDEYTPSSPMDLPDTAKAIVRISQAIAQKEHITVYGDYDVDGVTGTSVLIAVLRKLGADVDYYIPNRAGEGYGLNLKAISIIASKRRTKLIITCDCGVSNFAEVNFARSLGVDTIVTDHHTMPEMLPPAVAILHPKQLAEEHPLFHLPGVGVAYKLCEALLQDRGMPEEAEKLLDFVTLGMIADLVPLVRENRYLVQIGLPKLIESPRPGLQSLLAQVRPNGGTDIVGFGLAPRINAVGRLSDANLAVELMTTDDPEVAQKIANQLQNENSRRQELCEQILFEAEQMIAEKLDLSNNRAIAIYKEGWHHGVVGIVASRLVDKYHRPVFIAELDADEQIIKGSARGVEGIDLYEALKANEQLLTRWGGHKMAAGFSAEAEKAETFCKAITDTCNRMLAEKSLNPVLDIDAVVNAGEVSMELVRQLARIAPFGMANKKPVLAMKKLACASSRPLGKEGKHSRIMLRDPDTGTQFESVMWNSKDRVPADNQLLDVAFNAEINSYNGNDRLQLILSDWIDLTNGGAGRPLAEQRSAGSAGFQPAPSAQTNPVAAQPPGPPEPVAPLAVPAVDVSVVPGASVGAGTASPRTPGIGSINITWKDLRDHASPESLLEAAARKLGDKLSVFSETMPKLPIASFTDRTALVRQPHLLLWQFPPSPQVFKSILMKSCATNVYMLRSHEPQAEDPSAFLRKLLGLVRYAVNQREGKAEQEKLEAALGTTKMSIALGLAILRKLNVVDWYNEDGFLYMDLLEQPVGSAESLPEFRQLTNSLKEIHEFRAWCAEGNLKELQLAVTPNHIDIKGRQEQSRRMDEFDQLESTDGSEEPAESAPYRSEQTELA